MKEDIVRLVEGGFLGRSKPADEDKGSRPMELDQANEWQPNDEYEYALAVIKGKGKGYWNGSNYAPNQSWNASKVSFKGCI